MVFSKVLILLAMLITVSTAKHALRIRPFPPSDGKCQKDCCKTGTSCCGTGCIPTNDLPTTLCAAIFDGCCQNPDNECAPDAPPPPVDEDPSDDSECCGKREECCSGRCVPKQNRWSSGGPVRVCLSKRGCCPPPPDDGPCSNNCCPEGLDCVCGGCSVFQGFPVLCSDQAPLDCCKNPENRCATEVVFSEK